MRVDDVLVEVDPEAGGEDEGETAALLERGLPVERGEVGAHKEGIGAVEGGEEAVRGAVEGDVRGPGAGGGVVEGDVRGQGVEWWRTAVKCRQRWGWR